MNKILEKNKMQGHENILILSCSLILLFITIAFRVVLFKDNIISWRMSIPFIAIFLSVIMIITINKNMTHILGILSNKFYLLSLAVVAYTMMNILFVDTINGRYRLLEPIMLLVPILFTIYSFKQKNCMKNVIGLSCMYVFSGCICYVINAYLQWVILCVSYIALMVMQIKVSAYSNKTLLYAGMGAITCLSFVILIYAYFRYNNYSFAYADLYLKESLQMLMHNVKWFGEGISFALQENFDLGILAATRFSFLYIACKYGLFFLIPIVAIYFVFYRQIIIGIKKETALYCKALKRVILFILTIQTIAYLIANMGIPIFYSNSMPLLFNDTTTMLVNSFLISLLFVKNETLNKTLKL